ncbi:MAG: hypothetical protein SFU99_23540, partial [Saprospiraceae bacterium]|nr:hypothetical protein [Saprospiraceae bacterium]
EQETEYSLSVSLSQTSYDFLNSSNFNQQGLTSNLMSIKNKVKSLSSQGHLAGMIGSDIDFNIRSLYRFSQRSNIINEEKVSIKNHYITLNTQINYTFTNSIFSVKPNFQLVSNNFFETPAYQIDAEVVYFIKLDRIGSFRTSYHQYFSAIGERAIWNEFLSIEYKHTLKKLNVDIILNINNLTKNIYYINFTQNNFSESFSYYQLKPRQIILSFIKKF